MFSSIKYNGSVVNSVIEDLFLFPGKYDTFAAEIESFVNSVIEATGFQDYVNTFSSSAFLSDLINECGDWEKSCVVDSIRDAQIQILQYSNDAELINDFVRSLNYYEYRKLDLEPIKKYITAETLEMKEYAIIPHSKISDEEREARMKYLMPDGAMSGDAEQESKYITSVEIPIWTGSEMKTQNIRVNAKLAERTKSLFKELADIKYPIAWDDDGGYYLATGYYWKSTSTTGKLSDHAFGGAFDINEAYNPFDFITYDQVPDTPYKVDERVVNIMAKYGFYWGGDWDLDKGNGDKPDYMHFSYTGK